MVRPSANTSKEAVALRIAALRFAVKRVRFELHCGYWPLPKQVELTFSFDDEPLPRGPDPVPTDSPEWFDLVGKGQGAGEPRSPVEALAPSVCPRCGILTDLGQRTCRRCGHDYAVPLPQPSPRGPGDPRVCR